VTLPYWDGSDDSLRFILDLIASRFVDTGGRSVGVRWGVQELTFSGAASSATEEVEHGLGTTPVIVLATADIDGDAWCLCLTGTYTDTTFEIAGRDTDAALITGTSNAYWLALG
jgi:hypothetical protein